jgi:hypothetical protein
MSQENVEAVRAAFEQFAQGDKGGSAGDILKGETGADVMRGMNGNDLLRARDLASDTTIDCDGGTIPGNDKAELDLLPLDSNVTSCETKTRH